MFFLPWKTKAELGVRLLDIGKPALVDGGFIYDMIIPLTLAEARARYAADFGDEPFATAMGGVVDENSNLWTCRHWDTETRLCTVYESRPGMCRDYPYGAACGGCSYQSSAEVAARHADSRSTWSWTGWRWRRGHYVAPKDFAPDDDWSPPSWAWDAERRTLTPEPSKPGEVAWSPRWREWVSV